MRHTDPEGMSQDLTSEDIACRRLHFPRGILALWDLQEQLIRSAKWIRSRPHAKTAFEDSHVELEADAEPAGRKHITN